MVGMLSDLYKQQSEVLDNTLSPQWFEQFQLYVTSYESDMLSIIMKDKGTTRDTKMTSLDLSLSRFEKGYVYDEWFEMTPAGNMKIGGKLRLRIQIAPAGIGPFQCPPWPKPPMAPATCMELIVNIHGANCNIGSSLGNSRGTCDWYAAVQFTGAIETRQKTRVIDNSVNPKWEEIFRMPINNLNTDVLDVMIIAKGETPHGECSAIWSLPLTQITPGHVTEEQIKLTAKNKKGDYQMYIAYQMIAPGMTPFVEHVFTCWQACVELASISGLPSVIESYFCEAKMSGDSKSQTSSVHDGAQTIDFGDRFGFLIRDPETEVVSFQLYRHEMSRKGMILPVSVAEFNMPLAGCRFGQPRDLWCDFGTGMKAHVYVHILQQGEQPFAAIAIPRPAPFIGKDFRYVHVHVMSTSIVLLGTKTLVSCKVVLDKRKRYDGAGRFVGWTRAVQVGGLVHWNQTFHIPIRCADSDVVKFKFFALSPKASKPLCIETHKVAISSLPFGVPVERVLGEKTENHLRVLMHVADFGQEAFVNKPFQVPVVHIKVKDAVELPPKPTTCARCSLLLSGATRPALTQNTVKTVTPQWFETFTFILGDQKTDTVTIFIIDKDGKDTVLGSIVLPMNNFKLGYVYEDWYRTTVPNGGEGPNLRLKIHVANPTDKPFSAPLVKPRCMPGQVMELFVRVRDGKDFKQGANSHVTICMLGWPKTLQSTRTIINSQHPKWDQILRIPVNSLNSDCLRVAAFNNGDWKDEFMGVVLKPLRDMSMGKVCDEWIPMGQDARIRLRYQLVMGGDIPFVKKPFVPLQIHVRIHRLDAPVSLLNPFVNVWVNHERSPVSTENRKSLVWEDDVKFLLTNPTLDVVHLSVCDNPDDLSVHDAPEFCHFQLRTADVPLGPGKAMTLDDGHGYKLYITTETTELGQDPFKGMNLPPKEPRVSSKMCLYVQVIEAMDVPTKANSGLCDPYVELSFKNRGKKTACAFKPLYTRYVKNTLNPCWNQVFPIDVICLNDDILMFTLFDHPDSGKDLEVGNESIKLSSLPAGVVKEETIWMGRTKLFVRLHLAGPDQSAFVDNPFQVQLMNIRVMEAKNVRAEAQQNPAVRLVLENGTKPASTSKRKDTDAPQWLEDRTILLTNLETDVLKVLMCNGGADIDKFLLRPKDYKIRQTVCDWFHFEKYPDMMLRLQLQVSYQGEPKFSDYVASHENVTSDDVTLHINIYQASKLPRVNNSRPNNLYVVVLNNDTKELYRSRIINSEDKPIWDQDFHITVTNFESEIHIKVKDDGGTKVKQTVIGEFSRRIDSLPYGTVVRSEEMLKSTKFKDPGWLTCTYHLANEGQTAFKDEPWIPYCIHAQVRATEDIREKIPDAHPILDVQLGPIDIDGHIMSGHLCDAFKTVVVSRKRDKLKIRLYNLVWGQDLQDLGSVSLPLDELEPEVVSTTTHVISPQFGIQFEISLILRPSTVTEPYFHVVPYNLYNIDPAPGTYCAFVNFQSSINKMYLCRMRMSGSTKSSYVVISPASESSQIVFDQVTSLNSENILIDIYRVTFNKAHHWDLFDAWLKSEISLPVRSLPMGGLEYRTEKFTGVCDEITLRVHVTTGDKAPLVPDPFPALVCKLLIIEMLNAPTDIKKRANYYCTAKLQSDQNDNGKFTTNIAKSSLTPQWNEETRLMLTSPNDVVLLEVCNSITRKPIGGATISLDSLAGGEPACLWLPCSVQDQSSPVPVLNVAVQVAPEDRCADLTTLSFPIPEEYMH